MSNITLLKSCLNGKVSVCSSKSGAHRALIVAALTCKYAVIHNVDLSEDIKATVRALRGLNVKILNKGRDFIIKSEDIKVVDKNPDFSESGSTLRFMIPIFSSLDKNITYNGTGRLPKRPLDEFFKIFERENISYNHPENNLPLTVCDKIRENSFSVRGDVSSQYITGLMLSALIRDCEVKIEITSHLESVDYVLMTKEILEDFGCKVSFEKGVIKVLGTKNEFKEYWVENDWSQGAFFLCGGAISGDVTLTKMNNNSSQGDREIVNVLKSFGADVEVGNDWVRVKKSDLKGIVIDARNIPDLVPVISVVGAYASGTTRIENIGRLKFKESDRLYAVVKMLKSCGCNVNYGDDYIEYYSEEEISECEIESFNDHRMVMSAAILALLKDRVTVNNKEAINKSYPEFFKDYVSLGGKTEGEFD